LCGAEQLLATELVFEGHMKWAEGDAMTAVERESERRLEIDEIRESRKFVTIASLNRALCDILCECPRGTHLRGL
jgi:hypothetical protein